MDGKGQAAEAHTALSLAPPQHAVMPPEMNWPRSRTGAVRFLTVSVFSFNFIDFLLSPPLVEDVESYPADQKELCGDDQTVQEALPVLKWHLAEGHLVVS